jgi:hypothetical protein
MAVKKSSSANKNEYIGLPYDTIIEVIATDGKDYIKKEMTYGEALNLKKKKGWRYDFYQKGFSQFK